MRRSRRRRQRNTGAEDVDVGPLMNLFVAIVPMLLLSAVFVSISAIELSMPAAGSVPQKRDDFVLALRITPEDWWVEARGRGPERLARGDTAALLQRLEDLHAEHPEHTSVIVACAEAVEYDEVVQVLDVAALAGFVDCALAGLDAVPAPAPIAAPATGRDS